MMGKQYASSGRPSKRFSGGSGAHGMNSYRNNGRGSQSGSKKSGGGGSIWSSPGKQTGYGKGKHKQQGHKKQFHF